MADYPFGLRGRQLNFEGIGHKEGEALREPGVHTGTKES